MRILQLTVSFRALGLTHERISYVRIIRIFLYFTGFPVCRYSKKSINIYLLLPLILVKLNKEVPTL